MTDYDKEIIALETESKTLHDKIIPLQEKFQKLNKELMALREKRDEELDPATLGVVEHLTYKNTMASYNRANAFFEGMGFWMNGCCPETNQRGLKIMAYKSRAGEVDRILAAMEKVIPHILPINGAKQFGIFEHTLSEDGQYRLEIPKDDRATIVISEYRRDRAILADVPLREAIEYIVENLYYE